MTRALLACALLCLAAPSFAQTFEPTPLPLPPPPPIETTVTPAVPAPPPPQEAPPEKRSGFSLKLSLGGTYRVLYGIHFGGGDLALSLGGQTKAAAFYAHLALFLGSTAFGLTTSDIQIGFAAEARVGQRFRVGGGAGFSLLMIRRITSQSTIFDFTVGPAIQSSYDLVQWEDSAFYVALRLAMEWLVLANENNNGIPLMGLATLGGGFRY